ncbi:MAG: LysR family transcriptional regulator [Proteobacteria bacterium]|nr:LysR family transcriptional regulator [Pseudomonadota bacterium]
MQLRHLRYFVKIVDAGSFSRAAATIHVAQPALSQQIAELEERLGIGLLLRTARGVRPTPAGEALYREAVSILRQVEQLPDIVRSTGAEAEGTVSLGMSTTLAAQFSGPLMEASRTALPKVLLKLISADSETLKRRIEAHTLDLAVVFEDDLTATFLREPLFRQRLFFICKTTARDTRSKIAVADLASEPLVLPSQPNVVRRMLDTAFNAAGVVPHVVAEADVLSGILAAVGQGLGATVLPRSDQAEFTGEPLRCIPIVTPVLHLTSSVIWSSDAPLTRPGEAVRKLLASFLRGAIVPSSAKGIEVAGA